MPTRREACQFLIPGFGPVADIVETRSLNPLTWSPATKAGLVWQAGLALTGCSPRPSETSQVSSQESLGYQFPLRIKLPHLVDYYPEIADLPATENGRFVTE